ncbi:DUF3237 domain-containing protein [Rhodalgimonas zhirmunskyi]|uniref:DUF3237 domain-containing protein n=1 Tax=Rhodalgimonas zhirmunskyi TaxID=2964767 RepID=A0AAJ1UAS3_9RHOB|nr:DUF3237 domain-containing protein [Rhodoalgimonas zhirmunskyi]MDQ2095025.1 DUF3237 domain-containing protein [Rhodoalgimonas zhirmunskyi]
MPPEKSHDAIHAQRPAIAPDLSLIWTAIVDIAPREDLGQGPTGQRYIVPILGGKFFAGPGIDGLSGTVLPGGADRQLIAPDGFKTLDALYEMQTDDGTVLTIHNHVKVDETAPSALYRRSVIEVTAPSGRLDWMNRRVFLGTLELAHPDREAVIIRSWGQAG